MADLYRHLPFMVVHLTLDGIVLHANPATTQTTGFDESFLIGRNFWATLFPGKLFAQVPRFISPVAPTPLLRDTPLTLRTKDGGQRTVAFTRFIHTPVSPSDPTDTGLKTMVCIGVDLTDRLLASDAPAVSAADPSDTKHFDEAASHLMPFGPEVGNGGAIDGEFVTPISISSPSPIYSSTSGGGAADASAEAIRQVHEFLTEIDARMGALQGAFEKGEMEALASVAQALGSGARACGLFEFSARAQQLQQAAALEQAAPVHALIGEMLALYQPHRK